MVDLNFWGIKVTEKVITRADNTPGKSEKCAGCIKVRNKQCIEGYTWALTADCLSKKLKPTKEEVAAAAAADKAKAAAARKATVAVRQRTQKVASKTAQPTRPITMLLPR